MRTEAPYRARHWARGSPASTDRDVGDAAPEVGDFESCCGTEFFGHGGGESDSSPTWDRVFERLGRVYQAAGATGCDAGAGVFNFCCI